MTITVISIIFICLFVSHIVCLLIGWQMALRSDPRLQLSRSDKKAETVFDIADEIDKEKLDYE